MGDSGGSPCQSTVPGDTFIHPQQEKNNKDSGGVSEPGVFNGSNIAEICAAPAFRCQNHLPRHFIWQTKSSPCLVGGGKEGAAWPVCGSWKSPDLVS